MRLHDLAADELAALRSAYAHKRGEVAALAHQRPAWATLEVLARKGLLHFHRTVQLPKDDSRAHVYRITSAGRAALHQEPAA